MDQDRAWLRSNARCPSHRPFSCACLHDTAQGGEAGGWGAALPPPALAGGNSAAATSTSFIRGTAERRERFPAPLYVTLKDTETIICLPRLEVDGRGSRSHKHTQARCSAPEPGCSPAPLPCLGFSPEQLSAARRTAVCHRGVLGPQVIVAVTKRHQLSTLWMPCC